MSYRIAVVGGGSTVFGPQFVRLLTDSKPLAGSTIVLMDIDERRVGMMCGLARFAARQAGADLSFESTVNRRDALKDADFVVVVAPVGGIEMRAQDLEIPARYGIYTMGGETVGPATMFRAFRHVPLFLDVCRELEELSPDAWLFSYTNPATPVLMAIERRSAVKKVFLCTCSAMARRPGFLARKAGVEPDELAMPAIVGGLNHCAAILRLCLKDGRDALPLVLERLKSPIEREMLERYGVLPYCTSHWAEFYPRFMRLEEPYEGHLQGLKMIHGYRVRNMAHDTKRAGVWEQDVEKLLAGKGEQQDALKGSDEQAELLGKVLVPGEGIEVVAIMEAIAENRNDIHAVIVPNHGAIPNLPSDTVVEVSAAVGAGGVYPLQVGPLPEPVAANMRKHVDFYRMIADASLAGDRKMALDALLHDPVTSAILTLCETEKLLDEMMEVEAEFLPQFE
jgi:alpha-galactosidase/6-phospho-beta-glucosidase family protein